MTELADPFHIDKHCQKRHGKASRDKKDKTGSDSSVFSDISCQEKTRLTEKQEKIINKSQLHKPIGSERASTKSLNRTRPRSRTKDGVKRSKSRTKLKTKVFEFFIYKLR